MSKVRNYIDSNDVWLGDIVRSFDDAFGTSIVERIEDNHSDAMVCLARPSMSVYGIGPAALHVERYKVSLETFVKNFVVYVRGREGAKDNRFYNIVSQDFT